jgi:hypothetical protein
VAVWGHSLVIDGPLRGRSHLDRAVGYIKTHHTAYLPADQAAVVSQLAPGQRTPAFTIGTSWLRNSWYLQLPHTTGVPWSGVVRVECSADLPVPEVTRLADLTALLLPPLASVPHKDPPRPAEPGPDRRPGTRTPAPPGRPANPLPRPARRSRRPPPARLRPVISLPTRKFKFIFIRTGSGAPIQDKVLGFPYA